MRRSAPRLPLRRASFGGTRAEYLSQVCGLLWPAPALVTLTSPGRDPLAVTPPGGGVSARPTPAPAELIVIPGRARPRLLVPTERRAAAAAVQGSSGPGLRTARLRKRAIRLAMASGAGPFLFRDRLRIQAPEDSPTIVSYLRAALGSDIRLSMHVGAPRANRKPVLQLLTAAGEPIGFAKIGIDPLTSRLGLAEREALAQLATARLGGLTVPRVLHYGTWNGLGVLVLGPLPTWRERRPLSDSRLAAAMREVAGIGGLTREPLAAAAHWQRLGARLSAADDRPDRAALGSALGRLADQAGGTVLCYGSWHGDWTPWNMASTGRGLLVWDWERFAHGVPIGFDALHHWLQTEVVPGRRDPANAARELIERAAALLDPFDVGADEARLTAVLYLAELAARYLADRQIEAGARLGAPGGWLIPAITSELARR
jgi:hypothetical protein